MRSRFRRPRVPPNLDRDPLWPNVLTAILPDTGRATVRVAMPKPMVRRISATRRSEPHDLARLDPDSVSGNVSGTPGPFPRREGVGKRHLVAGNHPDSRFRHRPASLR